MNKLVCVSKQSVYRSSGESVRFKVEWHPSRNKRDVYLADSVYQDLLKVLTPDQQEWFKSWGSTYVNERRLDPLLLEWYEATYTDTFGGELNYAWVNRVRVKAKNLKHAAKLARKELGITMRGRWEDLGDSAMWRPYGCCTALVVEPWWEGR